MKDINQIKLLVDAFTKKKDKYMLELSKINNQISSKESMIEKMKFYKNEYINGDKLIISKSIPGLNKNIDLFVDKIDVVIKQSESEVLESKKIKNKLLETINNYDKKINLMNHFEEKVLIDLKIKEDKYDQLTVDNLVSTINEREDHE